MESLGAMVGLPRWFLLSLTLWCVTRAMSPGLGEAPLSISGVSGRRFSGEVLRELPELRFEGLKRGDLKALRPSQSCERWIVVTSIFQPSPATRKLGEMTRQGWCYVVVADKNGPKDYDDVEGVIYLTVERQRALHFHIMDHLPWRHFGRKNVGFLFAIANGAKVIYDTDDDNRLKEAKIPILGLNAGMVNVTWPLDEPRSPQMQLGLLNPYPSFRPSCGHVWPRGFPLDYVQSRQTYNRSVRVAQLDRAPAVQQFLADEDPDVDAIFRLTRPLPCSFEGQEPERPEAMAIPPEFFTPYNAQATVHLYEAFWGFLLPVTVHGRVSDIWRAYLTQKLLWDIGQVITFHPSYVVHDRVAHDYLKDFQSEGDLQLKSTAMVQFLSQWSSDAPTLLERIEQLWAALYARGFVELGDVRLAQAWIRDLIAVGYDFPELRLGKIMWADGSRERRNEL